MSLIVEDGSGIANANSYVSLENARIYASSLGLDLPPDDLDAEAVLASAIFYIDSQQFQGYRTTGVQALQWPRKGVVANGYPVDENVIPSSIWQAQVRAAVLITDGIVLTPDQFESGIVKKEKVGPIETEYSDYSTYSSSGLFPTVDLLLSAYLISFGGYRLSPQFGF